MIKKFLIIAVAAAASTPNPGRLNRSSQSLEADQSPIYEEVVPGESSQETSASGSPIYNPDTSDAQRPYYRRERDFLTTNRYLLDNAYWKKLREVLLRKKDGRGGVVRTLLLRFDVFSFKNQNAIGNEELESEDVQLVLKQVSAKDRPETEQLKHESDILEGLDHPNIARWYGLFPDELSGSWRLAMEGCAYGSIEHLVAKKSPMLTLEVRKKLLRQVWEAILYMRKQGVVHRDIKLENLIIMNDGSVRLIDFGLAMRVPQERIQCQSTGKPISNVAPEAYDKSACSTLSSDLWSFGVLLIDLLAIGSRLPGFLPNAKRNTPQHVYSTVKTACGKKFREGVYAGTIVAKLLQVDPELRETLVRCEEVEAVLQSSNENSEQLNGVSEERKFSKLVAPDQQFYSHVNPFSHNSQEQQTTDGCYGDDISDQFFNTQPEMHYSQQFPQYPEDLYQEYNRFAPRTINNMH